MKITVEDSTVTPRIPPFVIGEDNGRVTGVSGFELTPDNLTQVVQGFRAQSVSHYDRKNDFTTVTFSVSRSHSSQDEAEAFVLEHRSKCPRAGLVTLISGMRGMGGVKRYLAKAVVKIGAERYAGTTSIIPYQILGGALLQNKPS